MMFNPRAMVRIAWMWAVSYFYTYPCPRWFLCLSMSTLKLFGIFCLKLFWWCLQLTVPNALLSKLQGDYGIETRLSSVLLFFFIFFECLMYPENVDTNIISRSLMRANSRRFPVSSNCSADLLTGESGALKIKVKATRFIRIYLKHRFIIFISAPIRFFFCIFFWLLYAYKTSLQALCVCCCICSFTLDHLK